MQDPRQIFDLIAEAKVKFPENITLIESITEKLNSIYKPITPKQRLSLRRYPTQYINRIPQEHGEWTSQLHIWAELGVLDILDLDPIFLSFKNSYGDSVLMSFFRGSTGSLTDTVNYEHIKKALSKDYRFLEPIPKDGETVEFEENDPMEDVDYFNQTPLDYLIDIAYAEGEYEGEQKDPNLQLIIDEYVERTENLHDLQPEESLIVEEPKLDEEKPNTDEKVLDKVNIETVKDTIISA